MDNIFDLEPLIPAKQPRGLRMLYGTVTQEAPLLVRVDGDTDPISIRSCQAATVGQRVVILSQDRVLVVVGVLK